MEKIFNAIVGWLYGLVNDILVWAGEWIVPAYEEFSGGAFYIPLLLLGTIALTALALVLLFKTSLYSGRAERRMERMEAKHPFIHGGCMAAGIFTMVIYALMLIWLVAMGTAGDSSFNLSMYGETPLTFGNFTEWMKFLQIPCAFVVFKIVLTLFGCVIGLHPVRFIRFIVITAACVGLGMIGGLLLTVVSNIAGSGFLGTLITLPVTFIINLVPNFVFWLPLVSVVWCLIGIILSPIIGIIDFMGLGGGNYAPSSSGAAHASADPLDNMKIKKVHTTVFNCFGDILYTYTEVFLCF